MCTLPTNSFVMCLCPCRIVLEGPLFEQYFRKVEVSNFEVASDAFTTFKASLYVSPLSRPMTLERAVLDLQNLDVLSFWVEDDVLKGVSFCRIF